MKKKKLIRWILFGILAAAFILPTGAAKTQAATMSLKASKAKTFKAKAGKNYYAKFKASKTGYVKIAATNTKYITLVNAKHKKIASCQEGTPEFQMPEIESKESGYAHYATYGVKKGKTYYVKITSLFSDKSTVKYTIFKNKVYAANKKSKAYVLKKGKLLRNAVIAGKKKTWWFKYKTTTNYRSLQIDFATSHIVEQYTNTKADSSDYTITAYDASGNVLDERTVTYNDYLYDYRFFGSAAQKGTWIYIKVTCSSKYNSGWFTLKAEDAENY